MSAEQKIEYNYLCWLKSQIGQLEPNQEIMLQ